MAERVEKAETAGTAEMEEQLLLPPLVTAETAETEEQLLRPPLVTEVKTAFSHLFKGRNKNLWFMCYPSEAAVHLRSPTSSSKNFVAELLGKMPAATKEFVRPVIEELNKAVEELFVGPATSNLAN